MIAAWVVLAAVNVALAATFWVLTMRRGRRSDTLRLSLVASFLLLATVDLVSGIDGGLGVGSIISTLLVDAILIAIATLYVTRERALRRTIEVERAQAEESSARLAQELAWEREHRALALRDRCGGFT